jgi:hypothetical protein
MCTGPEAKQSAFMGFNPAGEYLPYEPQRANVNATSCSAEGLGVL